MNRYKLKTKGFTLVEIVVVMGIFALLTGVVLTNYKDYNTNANFANASEDLVLLFRQAQVYSIGSKAFTSVCGTGSAFTCPYGVHIDTVLNKATLFADINGDHMPSMGETAGLTQFDSTWVSPIIISSLLCDGIVCTGNGAGATFSRPNPDAFIADIAGQTTSYGILSVTLQDTRTGKTATVAIRSSGQVSLQ